MGLCPSGVAEAPTFGAGPSVSAARMDRLYPAWRERAIGANAWWTKRAYDRGEYSHVSQILEQTSCSIVVALGHETVRACGIMSGSLYTWGGYRSPHGWIDILRFPHPSGLNRHWNDPDNVRRAQIALAEVFTDEGAWI